MEMLVLGLALFLLIHLLPSISSLRAAAVARLGPPLYRGLFAAIAASGLVLLIYGKSRAPYIHGFAPPFWGRHVTMLLMLLSSICFAALYLPTNLKRLTPHPMLWGTAFWGAGHLFANGDVASILLFGALLSFALFDIYSMNKRGARPAEESLPRTSDALVIAFGFVIYALMIYLHPKVIGVEVFPS